MINTKAQHLAVAVPTFRRPEMLADLLAALVAEAEIAGAAPGAVVDGQPVDVAPAVVEVLVIDNDPQQTAEPVVAAHRHRHTGGPAVRYLPEPEPGVVAVRNRALSEATDLVAFIDDDELPEAGWLAQLLTTRVRFDAELVAGVVLADYESELDPWIAAGRFFVRRRMPTGSVLDVAAAGNMLLDLAAIRRTNLSFDPRFGLTGGEDTFLTRQLGRRGVRMVWCDEAIIYDRVPSSRMTRRWVLARAMSSGNTAGTIDVLLARGAGQRAAVRLRLLGKSLARVAGGLGRAGVGYVLRRPVDQARGVRAVARGVGMAMAAVGWNYREYRREASPPVVPPVGPGRLEVGAREVATGTAAERRAGV